MSGIRHSRSISPQRDRIRRPLHFWRGVWCWWWIIRLWCLYFRLYLPVFFRHRMIIMTGGVQPIFVRILRYAAALAAVLLPGFYIALAGFHPEALPLSFALSFAASREGVPFTLPVEVIVMELAFELLREAGIRLPGPMGSTLGIVGGLIIGQAAVDAHIVSPVVVILVALTALSAFTIPNELFASAFRMVKFYLIIAASLGGFVGLTAAVLTVMLHLSGLKSFGVPYMMPFVSAEMAPEGKWQDSLWRIPMGRMYERPYFTKKGHRRRLRKEKKDAIR